MTTTPANLTFKLYPYATFDETLTLKDANEVARDLTGYTGLMHIKRDREDTAPLFTLTTADSSLVLGGAAGTVSLTLTPAQTGSVTLDPEGEMWVYDLLLTNTTPNPDRVERTIQGMIVVYPGVTVPT